ncbi:hypothetical protein [Paramicrobacterium chengjingii]|uniref:Uncharacterized protein n=1 Tax=Paramicrobacterium chengjingii TaxID=2769067 RepID=A0ABX6YLV3_9MICO|nr:hypothetical protein [Microbacterium chengjingii]QPZ39702.1 hypothetical protein HCR76_06560 [Microbacterium chengjingii]
MRLRKRHLPHRVDIAVLVGVGEAGEVWDTMTDVPAYVEQKSHLRVDRRSTSSTAGQEITSSTFVALLPDNDVGPKAKVTVWKGTPRERTSEVIDSSFYDYRSTPNHTELFLE